MLNLAQKKKGAVAPLIPMSNITSELVSTSRGTDYIFIVLQQSLFVNHKYHINGCLNILPLVFSK